MSKKRKNEAPTGCISSFFYIFAVIILISLCIAAIAISLTVGIAILVLAAPYLAMFGIQKIPDKYRKTKIFLTAIVDFAAFLIFLCGVFSYYDNEVDNSTAVFLIVYSAGIALSAFIFRIILKKNVLKTKPFKYAPPLSPTAVPVSTNLLSGDSTQNEAQNKSDVKQNAVAYRSYDDTKTNIESSYLKEKYGNFSISPSNEFKKIIHNDSRNNASEVNQSQSVIDEKKQTNQLEYTQPSVTQPPLSPTAAPVSTNLPSGDSIQNEAQTKSNVKQNAVAYRSYNDAKTYIRNSYLKEKYGNFIIPQFYELKETVNDDDPNDFDDLCAEDRTSVMGAISVAKSSKYKDEFCSLGVFNETTFVRPKSQEILYEVIIQRFGDSESPCDMLAVALAYEKKGAYGIEKETEYLMSYFNTATAAQMTDIQDHFRFGGIFDNQKRLIDLLSRQGRLLDAHAYATEVEEMNDGDSFEPAKLLGDIYLKLDPINCIGYYESLMQSGKYKKFTDDIVREHKIARLAAESDRKYNTPKITITNEMIEREEKIKKAAKIFSASL